MSDEATLAGLRLADSALPVGSDSVSMGLEAFVAADRVTGPEDLDALLETYLSAVFGPGDFVALRAAHEAAADGDVDGIGRADRRLDAVTLAAELREGSTRTGRRLLSLQSALRDDRVLDRYGACVTDGDDPGHYAVAFGAVAARDDVPVREACLLAGHQFVTGMLGAAQRLLQLGHTGVQRTLDDLRPALVAAVDRSAGRSLSEMAPFAPLIDVCSADHERADRRLFLS